MLSTIVTYSFEERKGRTKFLLAGLTASQRRLLFSKAITPKHYRLWQAELVFNKKPRKAAERRVGQRWLVCQNGVMLSSKGRDLRYDTCKVICKFAENKLFWAYI